MFIRVFDSLPCAPKSKKLRSLTGVKPTGIPHVGNYLGAMRPAIQLSRDYDSFLFIADLHALTTARDPKRLAEETYSVTATWLAAGLDPQTTVLYKQTDVPEIATLAWILSCFTPLGLLNRAHSVKDARQKSADTPEAPPAEDSAAEAPGAFAELEMDINHGVFAYPVLMAADILLYDTDIVPVGKDQKQHVEIAQEIARKINHTYGGEVLRVPKARIDEQVMTIPGIDGRKMSKSYDNGIELFSTDKEWKKRIALIKTDSTPYGSPLSPEGDTIFQLYRNLLGPERAARLERSYRSGRKDPDRADRDAEDNLFGWGHAKAALLEAMIEELGPVRAEYLRLMADKPYLRRLLREGAERARAVAEVVLRRVVDATGLVP